MQLIESLEDLEKELYSLELLVRGDRGVSEVFVSNAESPQRLLALRAPSGAAAHLSDQHYGQYGVYWASGDGSNIDESQEESELQMAAFGSACQFSALGPLDPQKAVNHFDSFFSNLKQEALLPYLRVFGGEAFIAGRDGSGCWEDFGDSHFIVPEITYVDPNPQNDRNKSKHPNSAFFLLVLTNQLQKNRARVEFLKRVLHGPAFQIRANPQKESLRVLKERSSLEKSAWAEAIDSIQEQISEGIVEKIVTARRVTLELSGSPKLPEILCRLNVSAPRCTRYSFRIGSRIFVAASPERLLRKRGLEVRTEALAGSISVKEKNAATELLHSEKDRKEHAFVVQAIHDALSPQCLSLTAETEPQVRKLKHVMHLQTPISGHLRASTHLLTLISTLHPTPAVGGLPQDKALQWIAAHEVSERGWYAAPFGWFDSKGDGEFRVSLRSALLNDNKVHLFAGAGIVSDSNSSSEYAETELKFIAMRDALGLVESKR